MTIHGSHRSNGILQPHIHVMMYDENVRFLNDKFQTNNWGKNAVQMAKCIYAPTAARSPTQLSI